jgi:hypothetical protein
MKFFKLITCFLFVMLNETPNYVPNEETAIKIAEAVWLPIYGEDIYNKKPYNAELIGDSVWHVYGSIIEPYYEINNKGDTIALHFTSGGVPHIWLKKSDAQVIKVTHTK